LDRERAPEDDVVAVFFCSTSLASGVVDDVLPRQIATALDLFLHKEPGKKLNARRRSVLPDKCSEVAWGRAGNGHQGLVGRTGLEDAPFVGEDTTPTVRPTSE
jgi:hypothetical protein